MAIVTVSPEAAYLTKNNICHPDLAAGATLTALEVKGRNDVASAHGLATVTGGSIPPKK